MTRNMSPDTAFLLFTQQRFQRPLFNEQGFQGRPELFKGISACHTDVCRGPTQRFPRDSTSRFFPFSPSRSGSHGPCLFAPLSSPTPTHIRVPLARGGREVDFELARVIANPQQSCTPCRRDSGIHLDGLIGASRISKFSNEWSETFSRSMMPRVATHSMRLLKGTRLPRWTLRGWGVCTRFIPTVCFSCSLRVVRVHGSGSTLKYSPGVRTVRGDLV